MAVMPLVPETKVEDVGKLISLGNLLVKKVTWLVFTTTSATFILTSAFGADCMTRIAYIYTHLPRTHSFPFRLTETTRSFTLWLTETHTLSNILTSSSHPHENAYVLQPFSFLSGLFGKTCSSLERNHRNFIKPRKRQTIKGEDTFLLEHVAIFLYINTLHEILSPYTCYSLQDTFNT